MRTVLAVRMVSWFERGRDKTNLIFGAADDVSSVVGRDCVPDPLGVASDGADEMPAWRSMDDHYK